MQLIQARLISCRNEGSTILDQPSQSFCISKVSVTLFIITIKGAFGNEHKNISSAQLDWTPGLSSLTVCSHHGQPMAEVPQKMIHRGSNDPHNFHELVQTIFETNQAGGHATAHDKNGWWELWFKASIAHFHI